MRPGAADGRAAQRAGDRAAGVGFGSRALAPRQVGPSRAAVAAAAPRPQPATRRGRAPALRCLRWRPPPGPWRSTSRSWSSTRPQTSNSKVGRGGRREGRTGGRGVAAAPGGPPPPPPALGPARGGARSLASSRPARPPPSCGARAPRCGGGLVLGPRAGAGSGRGRWGGRPGAGRALRQRGQAAGRSPRRATPAPGRHLHVDSGAAGPEGAPRGGFSWGC